MKKQRVTIFIDQMLVKRLRIMALEHQVTVSRYIEDFVLEEYEEWEALKKKFPDIEIKDGNKLNESN